MELKVWRLSQNPKLTLAGAAELFGISGNNSARKYQRYENGETAIDVVLAARIIERTEEAVTPADLARTREAWLTSANEAAA